MARPAGVRNQDFEAKRHALLRKLTDFALSDGVELPSFRQLAIAAGVSEPTLRHYFGNRSGVVVEIMENLHRMSQSMFLAIRRSDSDVGKSLEEYHEILTELMNHRRFIRAHAFGIREGLSDPAARKAYLIHIVEPTNNALAERLVKAKGGPRNFQAAKAAATMLSSSSAMLIVHQELLGGKQHAPMDTDWYLELVRNWMKHGLVANPEGLESQTG